MRQQTVDAIMQLVQSKWGELARLEHSRITALRAKIQDELETEHSWVNEDFEKHDFRVDDILKGLSSPFGRSGFDLPPGLTMRHQYDAVTMFMTVAHRYWEQYERGERTSAMYEEMRAADWPSTDYGEMKTSNVTYSDEGRLLYAKLQAWDRTSNKLTGPIGQLSVDLSMATTPEQVKKAISEFITVALT